MILNDTQISFILKGRFHIVNKKVDNYLYFIDRILSAKQKDPDTDTSALERQIDQMVYKLYGLTEEEIKIVENSNRE